MGTYLNPGNQGFCGIRNDTYIDKSGLIRLINDTIDTPRRLTCVSRPRRFGKSFAAQMLCAYYDKTCDSSSLFVSAGELCTGISFSGCQLQGKEDIPIRDSDTLFYSNHEFFP